VNGGHRNVQRISLGGFRHSSVRDESRGQLPHFVIENQFLDAGQACQAAGGGIVIPAGRLNNDQLRDERVEAMPVSLPPFSRDLLPGGGPHVACGPRRQVAGN
jgi:hypothetical protein